MRGIVHKKALNSGAKTALFNLPFFSLCLRGGSHLRAILASSISALFLLSLGTSLASRRLFVLALHDILDYVGQSLAIESEGLQSRLRKKLVDVFVVLGVGVAVVFRDSSLWKGKDPSDFFLVDFASR